MVEQGERRSRIPTGSEIAYSDCGERFVAEYTSEDSDPVLTETGDVHVERDVFTSETAAEIREALAEWLSPTLVTGDKPIPESVVGEMDESGTEQLPKSYRLRGCMLDEESNESYHRAKEAGVVDLLESPTLHSLAEGMTGLELDGPVGREVLCYQPGDYSGPHTDHHPEDSDRADGYVDVHVTVSEPTVTRQLLVTEDDGHLSEAYDIGVESAISVSRLPTWHYTTPLEGETDDARRWLLLATYQRA